MKIWRTKKEQKNLEEKLNTKLKERKTSIYWYRKFKLLLLFLLNLLEAILFRLKLNHYFLSSGNFLIFMLCTYSYFYCLVYWLNWFSNELFLPIWYLLLILKYITTINNEFKIFKIKQDYFANAFENFYTVIFWTTIVSHIKYPDWFL